MADQEVRLDGLANVSKTFARITGAIEDPKFFARTGEYLRATIKRRTIEGKDADGVAFIPYSRFWAAERMAVGLQVAHVDLFWSGQMMNAMTTDVTPKSVRVFFAATQAWDPRSRQGEGTLQGAPVTQAEKAAHLYKRRKFFAMSKEQITYIMKSYAESIRKAMSGEHGGE